MPCSSGSVGRTATTEGVGVRAPVAPQSSASPFRMRKNTITYRDDGQRHRHTQLFCFPSAVSHGASPARRTAPSMSFKSTVPAGRMNIAAGMDSVLEGTPAGGVNRADVGRAAGEHFALHRTPALTAASSISRTTAGCAITPRSMILTAVPCPDATQHSSCSHCCADNRPQSSHRAHRHISGATATCHQCAAQADFLLRGEHGDDLVLAVLQAFQGFNQHRAAGAVVQIGARQSYRPCRTPRRARPPNRPPAPSFPPLPWRMRRYR